MAIYHLSIKQISRSSGRSSVAASAYRSGTLLTNESDGVTHDYRKRNGVIHEEILLPTTAPREYLDRSVLWNAVERSEKRKDSQTAREIEIALPVELDREEQIKVIREYIIDTYVKEGMCADIAIHDTDGHNPHAHVMLTMRHVTEQGFGQKNRDWNAAPLAEAWRAAWTKFCNEALEYQRCPERIDHRSYKRQGIDRVPTSHLGKDAHRLEQQGIQTKPGIWNRRASEINHENETYQNIKSKAMKTQFMSTIALPKLPCMPKDVVRIIAFYTVNWIDHKLQTQKGIQRQWMQNQSFEKTKTITSTKEHPVEQQPDNLTMEGRAKAIESWASAILATKQEIFQAMVNLEKAEAALPRIETREEPSEVPRLERQLENLRTAKTLFNEIEQLSKEKAQLISEKNSLRVSWLGSVIPFWHSQKSQELDQKIEWLTHQINQKSREMPRTNGGFTGVDYDRTIVRLEEQIKAQQEKEKALAGQHQQEKTAKEREIRMRYGLPEMEKRLSAILDRYQAIFSELAGQSEGVQVAVHKLVWRVDTTLDPRGRSRLTFLERPRSIEARTEEFLRKYYSNNISTKVKQQLDELLPSTAVIHEQPEQKRRPIREALREAKRQIEQEQQEKKQERSQPQHGRGFGL